MLTIWLVPILHARLHIFNSSVGAFFLFCLIRCSTLEPTVWPVDFEQVLIWLSATARSGDRGESRYGRLAIVKHPDLTNE